MLTVIGLSPSGSVTVHTYTQTIHRTQLQAHLGAYDQNFSLPSKLRGFFFKEWWGALFDKSVGLSLEGTVLAISVGLSKHWGSTAILVEGP